MINQNGYSNGKPLTCERYITISVKNNYVIAEITVHDEMIFSSKLYQGITTFKFGNFRGTSICTHTCAHEAKSRAAFPPECHLMK